MDTDRSSHTVLVVDDDGDLRQGLMELLSDLGWRTVGARDGLEAKTLLERGLAPCVVLLDLMMPRMSGEEFLDWLRASGLQSAKTPVIVMTAAGAEQLKGAHRVMQKPVDLDAMLTDVTRLCPHQT